MLKHWFFKWQPLDRVALGLITVVMVMIAGLAWGGDQTLPRVRYFTWQDRDIGAADRAFILSFSRQMDWELISEAITIDPPLPGKTSWSGRRLAYTLLEPIPYGQGFQINVDIPTEPPAKPEMEPFSGFFRSRDRVIAYIGTGPEAGKLILNNLTLQQKLTLTPANLNVLDFQLYPSGEKILFSATPSDQSNGDPELYTVTTGLVVTPPEEPTHSPRPPGEVTKILDNRDYQLVKFELSQDGQRLVIQRIQRGPAGGEASLWLIEGDQAPQQLNQPATGDFHIAPDSENLVMAQGQGLAIVPLTKQQQAELLSFLPQYGMVLAFSPDGRDAAMVKFNPDFTRSLYLVNSQGQAKELLKTTGSLLSAAFDPRGKVLYCLMTRLRPDEQFREQSFIAMVDIRDGHLTPILDLIGQKNLGIGLAADGSGLVFDQTTPGQQQDFQVILLPIQALEQGEVIKLLPPQTLGPGIHPQWFP
ncbi:hypothetical protein [Synechococcus sp. PCC 6312]|uniref:hypothetical protein n=1 Tax=Synechococcus sp. (strain ATCC 27167 / PCC 6312) TaxID=195253 RepID=UPI00029EE8DB|nr:hypothetical protein [Synechococcus sp. PCC 6312]AFY60572.1 hypothetical protein Syn6312_1401 [Synechococcus sp. PCC 6312]